MSYPFFGVVGMELEYPVVGEDLSIRCRVEDLFRHLHGRPTSDVELGPVAFSNELAAHVFELKTTEPVASLAEAETILADGVFRVNEVLQSEWGERLLPTGMHPFMSPSETRLWPRAGRKIYEAYAAVFDLQGHGWLNVQSCHLNFPFGTEEETMRLHTAALCLLPYLPAMAASSPIFDGRPGPAVDNRLVFYRGNQARLPEAAGRVVPEHVASYKEYRRVVLEPIYRKLRRIPEAERLRHEWVNSRGAILRFWRDALEVRILDVQECPKMDVALAVFVRGALKVLVRRLERGDLSVPSQDVLVDDLSRVIDDGSRAEVTAPHLGSEGRPASEVLAGLLDRTADETPDDERAYLPLVEERLTGGNLSERIRRRVEAAEPDRRTETIRTVYEELAGCLAANRPWD